MVSLTPLQLQTFERTLYASYNNLVDFAVSGDGVLIFTQQFPLKSSDYMLKLALESAFNP